MKTTKKIHKGWIEWENARKNYPDFKMRCVFGKYQYIYQEGEVMISLVEFPDYFRDGKTIWEIYCLGKEVFEDTERFGSKMDALIRIKKLLKNEI